MTKHRAPRNKSTKLEYHLAQFLVLLVLFGFIAIILVIIYFVAGLFLQYPYPIIIVLVIIAFSVFRSVIPSKRKRR